MKFRILINLLSIIMLFAMSCHRETSSTLLQQKGKSQSCVLQLLQQLDSLGIVGEFNSVIAKDFIAKAEEFGNAYPEDPMSPEMIYNAALMAMTVAKISDNKDETDYYCQKALVLFDAIQKIYPEFSGIKNCILNKGVIYDDILEDYVNAEFYYKEFIARYPMDTLAINMEAYLQFLGKSPEEILTEAK